MVLAFKEHESSARNQSGDAAAFFKKDSVVSPGMEHQGGDRYLSQALAKVNFPPLGLDLLGVLRGSRRFLQTHEAELLIGGGFRLELIDERPLVVWVLLAPAVLCETEQCLPFLSVCLILMSPTVGASPVQRQVANLFGVAGRVLYGHRTPLRRPEKSESVETQSSYQEFQVAH